MSRNLIFASLSTLVLASFGVDFKGTAGGPGNIDWILPEEGGVQVVTEGTGNVQAGGRWVAKLKVRGTTGTLLIFR